VISGLSGRELEFLREMLSSSQWNEATPIRSAVLGALSRCVFASNSPKRIAPLLDLIASQSPQQSWRQIAMLESLQTDEDNRRQTKQIMIEAEPKAFVLLKQSTVPGVARRVKNVLRVVHWPGEPGYVPPPPPKPLTVEERARFDRGKQVYALTCIACHKENGLGQEGMAPPLLDSEWALGKPDRLAKIVVGGLSGPVRVNGRTWNLEMPGLAKLSDEDIAAVLTYVCRNWDHAASPIDANLIREVRATPRPLPWTERELLSDDRPQKRRNPKANSRPNIPPTDGPAKRGNAR